MEGKLWKNEELKRLEEPPAPRLKESNLEEVSGLYKAKTGVGCDRFHPKVPLDLTKVLGKGEAEWQMAAISLHGDVLLDPEACHDVRDRCRL